MQEVSPVPGTAIPEVGPVPGTATPKVSTMRCKKLLALCQLWRDVSDSGCYRFGIQFASYHPQCVINYLNSL